MKPFVLIMILFLFSAAQPTSELSAQAQPYSVDQLVQGMLKSNYSLKMQLLSEKIEQKNLALEGRWPNPQLGFSLGQGKPFSGDEGTRRIWAMGMEMPLPNILARSQWLRGLESKKLAATWHRRHQKSRLIHEFRLLIYALQAQEGRLKLQEQLLDDLSRIEQIVSQWVAVGESKRVELLHARSTLGIARAERIALQNDVAALRQEISAMTGGTLARDFVFKADWTIPDEQFDLDLLQDRLERSPAIREQRALLATSIGFLRSAQSGWFPDLSIHLEHAQELDAKVWKGGIGLEFPLFSGKTSMLPVYKYERERTELSLKSELTMRQAELSRLTGELTALKELMIQQEELGEPSGGEQLRLAEISLKAGEISLFVFLETRRSWMAFQIIRQNTIVQYLKVRSALEALLGEKDD